MGRNCNSFNSFIFGAIVGAIAGVVFAPTSGVQTRDKLKKIKESNEDLIQETRDKTENMIEKTLDAIDQGFAKLTEMVDEEKSKPKTTRKPKEAKS